MSDNTTLDAAFPDKPTLEIVDRSFAKASRVPFGIWERISVMVGDEMVLPENTIDVDPNLFYVQLNDPAGTIKESSPEVGVVYARGSGPQGSIVAPMTKKSASTFRSRALMLISDIEELRNQDASFHALAGRMMEAHLGGTVQATYSGIKSDPLPVGSDPRSYRVHFFVVVQHPDAPNGPTDPLMTAKLASSQLQYARALRVYERLSMTLRGENYAGIATDDLVANNTLVDGTRLHVVLGPADYDVNAMTEAGMCAVAAKYPKQNGRARVFVVGHFGRRGLSFPARTEGVPTGTTIANPELTDSTFINGATAMPLTISHELGHLLETDHTGNEFCLMQAVTEERASWRTSKWIYQKEFNTWPYRALTSP